LVEGAARSHDKRWLILAILGIAQLMVVLDATVVNIALPSAQEALGFSESARQWIVTAYSLTFGSLLLLGGRISDIFGRKWTFVGGLIGFAFASAPSFGALVVARGVQGLFGAILAPAALSLLTVTFTDPKERGKAFGVFGARLRPDLRPLDRDRDARRPRRRGGDRLGDGQHQPAGRRLDRGGTALDDLGDRDRRPALRPHLEADRGRRVGRRRARLHHLLLLGGGDLRDRRDLRLRVAAGALTEISNAAVALHREHFGRGPGAAKTHLSDNLVVCVLTDVFTPVERTLIDAGQEARVGDTRAAHRAAAEDVYKERMEAVLDGGSKPT
jgi:Major Facilitator Superfamily/Na+-translocating membrane potential-generating system (MpsC)